MIKKRKTLLLLDGNAIVHRAYHAIPPLSTDDGIQTNAVYGFTATLLTVLEKFQPDYIIASFDLPGKNFRHDMFPEYKAKRKETPEDLIPQFELVKDVVRSLGITIIEKDGFEADDVIGTIAQQATKDGVETVIVTGDKDTFQLVNDHVRVFTMSRGIHDMMLYDEEMVKEKMGVSVDQVIDYKGLRGDTSDNIPGVMGIGEKTAIDLLSQYKDLDEIYLHLDDIKENVRKKLEKDREKAYLSRTLGTIVLHVPIDAIVYGKIIAKNITFDHARATFHKLGFLSLMKRLPKEANVEKVEEVYKIVYVDVKDVQDILKKISQKKCAITWDTNNDHIYGIASYMEGTVYYISYTQDTKEVCDHYLNSSTSLKIVFDVKSVLKTLEQNDIILNGVETDVLLQAYVVQQNKKLSFDALAFDIFGINIEKQKKSNQMSLMLRDDQEEKNDVCMRAYYTSVIYLHFEKIIQSLIATQKKDANINFVLHKIEMPLIQILYKMEKAGIMIDIARFKDIAKKIDEEIDILTQKIYQLAGEVFNINSTQQLRVILFGKLQISTKDIKKTKTGYSTASSELQKIHAEHRIIAHIERYRELFKLKTTYVDVLPRLADTKKRIHTTFNQAVASTGRLSSSDPNVQNIPIRTEDGRRLREGFVAEKGHKLVSVDYSQIDLRCVAHVSGDVAMIEAFQNNMDIHTYTAAHVLEIPELEVTKDQRRNAKELNFGLIYGMGQFGFARAAGIDTKQAKVFITTYFEKFSGVKKYIDDTKQQAMKDGYVETVFGRRRYVKEIQSKNFQLRSAGERAAINMPIQGLAADIMKLAMIAADHHIDTNYDYDGVNAILQIHDEIIFEVREDLVNDFSSKIVNIMENVCMLAVPLKVDVSIGDRWSEL